MCTLIYPRNHLKNLGPTRGHYNQTVSFLLAIIHITSLGLYTSLQMSCLLESLIEWRDPRPQQRSQTATPTHNNANRSEVRYALEIADTTTLTIPLTFAL